MTLQEQVRTIAGYLANAMGVEPQKIVVGEARSSKIPFLLNGQQVAVVRSDSGEGAYSFNFPFNFQLPVDYQRKSYAPFSLPNGEGFTLSGASLSYHIDRHPELSEARLKIWVAKDEDLKKSGQAVLDDYKTLKPQLESNARKIFTNFLEIAEIVPMEAVQ